MVQTQFRKKALNTRLLRKFIQTKLISLSLSFSLGFTCFFASLMGQVDPASYENECSKEVLLAYFPRIIVNDTLKRFNVAEEKWPEIINLLVQKDKEIVLLVEKKASGITPNPLKDPQQRQLAVKLYRDTLLEVFTEALVKADITDETQIKSMLEDIQQQKAKRFALCLERHQKEIKNSSD